MHREYTTVQSSENRTAVAVRCEPEGYDLSALNRRMPLPAAEVDADDRRAALEVRAELWRAGSADDAAVFAAAAVKAMQAAGPDLENDEAAEMTRRLYGILRGDRTLTGPPSPQAAAWIGRGFEDEQRQDLLVVAAGQFLAGRLDESGPELFRRLRELDWMGLPDADVAAVAQALLRRIAAATAENWVGMVEPTVGYGVRWRQSGDGASGGAYDRHNFVSTEKGRVQEVSPGLMRLRIVGDFYELECELWPCPVTMKAGDFLRARSSAREIFKQAGIQPDSPAGRWREVWELHGLRDKLIRAADRDDPRARQARIENWLRTVEAAAPSADRATKDGSAARLPDGAVAASIAWLVARCIGDAIARESEREAVEATIRANTAEKIRRVEGGRAVRLRILPRKPPLVIEAAYSEDEKTPLRVARDANPL